MFIDIHSHVDICKDIDVLIKNAKKENVKILTAGTSPKSNRKILELKEKYPEINICLGIYPIDALELSEKEKTRNFFINSSSGKSQIKEIDSEIEFIKKNKSNKTEISNEDLLKAFREDLMRIENKIEKLDLVFLNKIQAQLSYKNPYFLVCLNEVIHEVSNNMSAVVKNLSINDLLSYLNKKAEYLYLNSNISEQLQTAIQEKNGAE